MDLIAYKLCLLGINVDTKGNRAIFPLTGEEL